MDDKAKRGANPALPSLSDIEHITLPPPTSLASFSANLTNSNRQAPAPQRLLPPMQSILTQQAIALPNTPTQYRNLTVEQLYRLNSPPSAWGDQSTLPSAQAIQETTIPPQQYPKSPTPSAYSSSPHRYSISKGDEISPLAQRLAIQSMTHHKSPQPSQPHHHSRSISNPQPFYTTPGQAAAGFDQAAVYRHQQHAYNTHYASFHYHYYQQAGLQQPMAMNTTPPDPQTYYNQPVQKRPLSSQAPSSKRLSTSPPPDPRQQPSGSSGSRTSSYGHLRSSQRPSSSALQMDSGFIIQHLSGLQFMLNLTFLSENDARFYTWAFCQYVLHRCHEVTTYGDLSAYRCYNRDCPFKVNFHQSKATESCPLATWRVTELIPHGDMCDAGPNPSQAQSSRLFSRRTHKYICRYIPSKAPKRQKSIVCGKVLTRAYGDRCSEDTRSKTWNLAVEEFEQLPNDLSTLWCLFYSFGEDSVDLAF